MIKLEHANLSVRNTEAMKKFLMTAFPDSGCVVAQQMARADPGVTSATTNSTSRCRASLTSPSAHPMTTQQVSTTSVGKSTISMLSRSA